MRGRSHAIAGAARVHDCRRPPARGPTTGSVVAAALDLLLTRHAGSDLRDRLEAGLADGLAALHAGAIGAVVDTLERGGQALDALDQSLAAHQPHLALLAGLDVVRLVPDAVGGRGRLLQRDGAAHLAQPARRRLPFPLETPAQLLHGTNAARVMVVVSRPCHSESANARLMCSRGYVCETSRSNGQRARLRTRKSSARGMTQASYLITPTIFLALHTSWAGSSSTLAPREIVPISR